MSDNPVEKMRESVVKINTASGSGSGFYLPRYNVVVTNHHVVAGNRAVALETHDKEKVAGRVVMVNPLLDVAFVRASKPLSSPPVDLRAEGGVNSSDKVAVLGYPFGMPFTVTEGIISAPSQLINGISYIQTDAAVNPGNSGGPIINAQGQVIAVTTCKFNEADNMGFGLPVNAFIDELHKTSELGDETIVKCPSCNYDIVEQSEYCDNCGSELSADLFTQLELSPLANFVEGCIQESGLNPVIARGGPEFWEFHKGSALIRIFVYRKSYLFATCPLVKLPKTNLEPVYEYVLSNPVAPYMLGVNQGLVYISYRFHLADLNAPQKDEIRQNLINLPQKADDLDNQLIDKYGCEWPEEAKPDA